MILPQKVLEAKDEVSDKTELNQDVSNTLQAMKVNVTEFDHIFLVMEYVESDLHRLLYQVSNVKLEESHVITILYNILCALNIIHASNVVHRDLKPANKLID